MWTAEEFVASSAPSAISTDGLWRRLYGSQPFAPGRAVTMNDVRYDVIVVVG
jgi:hypothetical protein